METHDQSCDTSSQTNGGDEVEEVDGKSPHQVLDLPQLYTRPTAETLLATLDELRPEPLSWDSVGRPNRKRRRVRNEGLPGYLTRIVSSPLSWIDNDDDREQIWEAAARCLSERSGRTAMGSFTRMFVIPLAQATGSEGSCSSSPADDQKIGREESIAITLHEPALTADNLGFKTWASSYLLAKRLPALQQNLPQKLKQCTILELGAGTGLVGIAAAAIFETNVVLTDLPDIVPNLARNANANEAMLTNRGGHVDTAVLDWSQPDKFSPHGSLSQAGKMFPLILVADPIYSSEHPQLLVKAIAHHLSDDASARVVIELPLRDAYAAERTDLRDSMNRIGLKILEEGQETGFDDWAQRGAEDELMEVLCWWSVWGR